MRKIYVKTRNSKGELESYRELDHDNLVDRVWLGKHCFWAFRNDRHVETGPIDDD